ncbi:hypothetical protein Fmac_010323 [Flemingia macrophylla]|uniref:S-protein homolog n=1 Tax=Flemingia macrophylla TaxID=520843 RepID=A0ABD1MJ86_9FABA
MSSSNKSVFLVCLLILLSSNNVLGKTHVRVTNTLEGGLDLTVHCKSKDNDIGIQHLRPNGFFEFSFRPNYFGTTLFYCSFQWQNVIHWFDIYVDKRDWTRCTDCYWSIKTTGPCLAANDRGTDCFKWNK